MSKLQIIEKRKNFVKWVNENALSEFQRTKGRDTVEEYLDEYSYIPDIYYGLALDLGYEDPNSLYDDDNPAHLQ